jgi:dTDP-4-amino-4,6-dideoxygalactose transaminase
MVKFLDLSAQYRLIKPEIDQAIENVLVQSAFIGGDYVRSFEEDFSSYLDAKFCIGVGNGTDALEIALEAAGFPPRSEIIVPGNSFIASAEAVTRAGHDVIFADVEPGCYTLLVEDVIKRITHKTVAIIAVHLYGQPCDLDPLVKLCDERRLFLIEDCAQAHGAEYKGRKVGTLGHIGTFSFYPGKNLGAYGDAGAIVTNDRLLAERSRMIANHGRVGKYDHQFEGRNSRLDGLQASILSVKLRHLDSWTSQRIEVAKYYSKNLDGIGDLILPSRREWARHVYHLFVIRTKQRDCLVKFLVEQGIETGIHYPIALPKLKAYAHLDAVDQSAFYNKTDSQLLSLPVGDHMTLRDAEKVVAAIDDYFSR